MWPGEGLWRTIKTWWNAPSGNYGQAVQSVAAQSFSASDMPVPQTNGEALFMSMAAAAYNTGHSAPGNLKISARTNVSVESPEPVSLGQRAIEIHSEVKPATQSRTTIAVGEGTDASGNTVRVVGSSEPNGLRKQQIAALKPGEIAATGPGHAEVTVMNYAKANDINIKSVGASRPICFNCALQIQANGVAAVTPLKVVKKVSQ